MRDYSTARLSLERFFPVIQCIACDMAWVMFSVGYSEYGDDAGYVVQFEQEKADYCPYCGEKQDVA